MAGVKALRKLQIGKCATDTPGTGVAATALLRFNGAWEDLQEVVFPEVDEGYLGGRDRAYIPKVLAQLAMEGPATFEQLPYVLDGALGLCAPTTDAGSGVTWTYNLPTTAQPELRYYTIESGDDNEATEAVYAYVSDFELSGKAGEAWNLSATWFGRQCSTSTFTASSDVTVTAVETMLFSKTKLYIDADSDTIGTTNKANTLLAADLKVKTGNQHVFTGDGNLYFTFVKTGMSEALLDVTFEHDGTASAELDAYRAKTSRLIRLLCEGTTLGTSDSNYDDKTLVIDLAGKWEKFSVLGEQDGNDIVTGTLRAKYNSTASLYGQIKVVNEIGALP